MRKTIDKNEVYKYLNVNDKHLERRQLFIYIKYSYYNDRGDFLHMGNTYVVRSDYLRAYDCGGRDFYSLCDVNEITDIMKVDFEYVESIITF